MPRYARHLLIAGGSLLLATCALLAGLLAVLASEGGTAWLATLLREKLESQIRWQTLSGSALDRIDLTGVEVRQPGLRFSAASAALAWRPAALLRGELAIDAVEVRDADLVIEEAPAAEAGDPPRPEDLRFPVAVSIDGVSLRDLRIRRGSEPVQIVELLSLTASLRDSDLRVSHLLLRTPEGSAELTGSVAVGRSMPFSLAVAADWRPAGTDHGSAANDDNPPLRARLQVDGTFDWDEALALGLAYRLELENINLLAPELPPAIATTGKLGVAERASALELQHFELAFADSPLELGLRGTLLDWQSQTPSFQLELTWRALQWPLTGAAADFSSAAGSLGVSGTPDRYALALEADVAGAQLPKSRWRGRAEGDQSALQSAELTGNVLDGSATVRGPIAWAPVPSWDLQLAIDGIDPAGLVPALAGPVEAELDSEGRIDSDGRPDVSITLRSLGATVAGLPLEARGSATLKGDSLRLSEAHVNSGANRMQASGTLSREQIDVNWILNAPKPGVLMQGATGQVNMTGRLSGSAEAPVLDAQLRGSTLSIETLSLASLDLDLSATLLDDPGFELQLDAGHLDDDGTPALESAALTAHGTASRHLIRFRAKAPKGGIESTLAGGLSMETAQWAGELVALVAEAQPLGRWQLARPASLSADPESLSLGETCLSGEGEGQHLCVDGSWRRAGPSSGSLTLSALPLAGLVTSVTGDLSAELSASLAADGALVADGDLRLGPGEVILPEGLARPALAHGGGSGTLTIGSSGLEAKFDIAAPAEGKVSADMTLPGLNTLPLKPQQGIAGSLRAELPDLTVLSALVEPIDSSAGRLSADLRLTGTLDRPEVGGTLALADGALTIPLAGIKVSDITLGAQGNPAEPGVLALDGSLVSGPGELELAGSVDLRGPSAELQIHGDQLEVFDTSDARVLLSPELRIAWSDDLLTLQGIVTVPKAAITPKLRLRAAAAGAPSTPDIPGTVIAPSPDVIVVGELETTSAQAPVPTAPFRVDAALNLLFGDDVQVNAVGLVSRIAGGVHFRIRPEQQELIPTAQGVIALEDGTFRAFGQDLDIETGQLIFADVPVTEPELNLRAVRWIDNDPNVSAAGVLLTGAVTAPELELFSRPQLETSAIQSYLLTGSATGAGDGVLSVGTYLTDQIYVGYGYNLLEETSEFDALFTVTPRYGLGADVGEADSNFNLTFTIER